MTIRYCILQTAQLHAPRCLHVLRAYNAILTQGLIGPQVSFHGDSILCSFFTSKWAVTNIVVRLFAGLSCSSTRVKRWRPGFKRRMPCYRTETWGETWKPSELYRGDTRYTSCSRRGVGWGMNFRYSHLPYNWIWVTPKQQLSQAFATNVTMTMWLWHHNFWEVSSYYNVRWTL